MGKSKRFWALCAASAAAIGAAASGCNDNDHTAICVGPDCPQYDGVGGERNFFRNGDPEPDTAGSAGAGGASADPPDAGEDPDTTPDATPDSGTVPPLPCEIAFVTPSAGDAGALTVDGANDVDGEACGPGFSLAVALTSSASSIALFINDALLSTQDVVDGAVSFDAVLGNRGATPNVLRAEATMADNRTCSLTLANDILVACPGPSCSIDAPLANADGYLNDSQDIDNDSGFQTDIVVGTEIDNLNQNVRLQIDGAFGTVPDALVLDDNGDGSATFGNVTLAEGPRSVRAECSDAFGLTTLSAPAAFNVDITPCAISINSIGANDPITPGDDLAPGPGVAGIQVLAAGQITGGDCKTLWIGLCDEELDPLSLSLPQDGSFSVPVTLTGSGSIDICGAVEDLAGNRSDEDRFTVNLRLDPPAVAIASPAPSTRFNLLGTSGAVADGNSLSSSCEAAVVVHCTELGQNVDLLADGSPIAQALCLAQSGLPSPYLGQASFAAASLPSKNDGSSTALTAQQAATGLTTGVSASVSVQADCDLPVCTLVNPDPDLDVLNAGFDGSNLTGFQLDVDVQSDANSLGPNLSLLIDGGSIPNAPLAGSGPPTWSFADVALTQGSHTVQARCVDAAGNAKTSTTETWTVDSLAPVPSITAPGCGTQLALPENDANLSAAGLQFDVVVANDGVADTTLTISRGAASSSTSATGTPSSTTFTALDLGGPGSVDLVACVTDDAGNQGCSASCTVRIAAHPSLDITSPADLAVLNGSTADCASGSAGLDVLVQGSSDAVDGSAVLIQIGAGALAPTTVNGGLYSTCVAAPEGLDQTVTVAVTHGTTGLSSSTSVQVDVDTVAPVPSITAPGCGSLLGIPGDDDDLGASGLQHDVTVANDGAAAGALTITQNASSSNAFATGDLVSTTFTAVDLGDPGSVDLIACVTDAAGNQGCTASCTLTIAASPNVAITSPANQALVSTADDCDGGTAGLQVTVSGTTDAAAGSSVQLRIGSGAVKTATANGTGFSDCVEAPEGNNQTLSASVTDQATSLSNATSILVSVDTTAPSNTIAAPTFSVAARRKGDIRLNWTSIFDSDGDRLSFYRLRCASTNITTELAWSNATDIPVTPLPAATAGSAETDLFFGLDKPGMTRFCVMRGEDAVGLLSPISSGLSVTLTNPFRTQEYTVTDDVGTNINLSIDPIGDIDSDGIDDFASGAANIGAQVFLGRTDLDSSQSDVLPASFSITNTTAVSTTLGFGAVVAGLGDISGDGRDDFAVTARGANVVFIFFGRASNTWGDINLTALSPCQADLCLIGSGLAAGAGLFGWEVHSANFDGAGARDLVISGRVISSTQANGGRVYVLLGGSQLATSGTTINLPTGTSVPPSALDPDGFVINPPAARTNFGISFSSTTGAGSVDDLIIGANGAGGAALASVVRVTGRSHGAAGTGLVTINTTTTDEIDASATAGNLGNPVRALDDLDGDGRQDVAAWRNLLSGNGVHVYRGLLGGGFNNLAGNVLHFANDSLPGLDDNYGTFIARSFDSAFCKGCLRALDPLVPVVGTIGDLDQDGFSELLIGATTPQTGTTGLGTLFYGPTGSADRARSTADFTYIPSNLQVVPNFVGDINDDTFPDFAVLDSGAGPNKVFLMY